MKKIVNPLAHPFVAKRGPEITAVDGAGIGQRLLPAVNTAHGTVALGAEVDVLADVTLARTRIVFDQAVAVGGAPAARARITCVCVDAETGRPRAPPDAVKDLFAA